MSPFPACLKISAPFLKNRMPNYFLKGGATLSQSLSESFKTLWKLEQLNLFLKKCGMKQFQEPQMVVFLLKPSFNNQKSDQSCKGG